MSNLGSELKLYRQRVGNQVYCKKHKKLDINMSENIASQHR